MSRWWRSNPWHSVARVSMNELNAVRRLAWNATYGRKEPLARSATYRLCQVGSRSYCSRKMSMTDMRQLTSHSGAHFPSHPIPRFIPVPLYCYYPMGTKYHDPFYPSPCPVMPPCRLTCLTRFLLCIHITVVEVKEPICE